MNYYPRHIGDYWRDAWHLSMLEHGAYTCLMDRYYSLEGGIPEDQKYKLSGARSEEERAAVDTILAEFFVREGDVWVQSRCEDVIAEFKGSQVGPTKAAERQRRYKERRSALFAEVRELGIVPPMETTNRELELMLRDGCGNAGNVSVTFQETAIKPKPKPKPNLSLVGKISDASPPSGEEIETPPPKTRLGPTPKEFETFFAEFRRLYPRRKGGLDVKKAGDKLRGKLAAKNWQERADVILGGVKRFAESCERDGKIGTEFVPMMSTWVNGERWGEDYQPPPVPPHEQPRPPRKLVPVIEPFVVEPAKPRSGNLGSFAPKPMPSDEDDERQKRQIFEQVKRTMAQPGAS